MSTKRQRQRMKNHTKKWDPRATLFAPRGNSDPTRMEERLRDAMRFKPHGEVKIFTQEEIAAFSQNAQKQVNHE